MFLFSVPTATGDALTNKLKRKDLKTKFTHLALTNVQGSNEPAKREYLGKIYRKRVLDLLVLTTRS